MDKAFERLNRSDGGPKKKILVYGDYDVDGTTAVALVYRYLQNFLLRARILYPHPLRGRLRRIPQKHRRYGRTRHEARNNSRLRNKGHRRDTLCSRERGIDFIICDHHVPDAELACGSHTQSQARRLHMPLPASFRLRRGLQTDAGVLYKQRHSHGRA